MFPMTGSGLGPGGKGNLRNLDNHVTATQSTARASKMYELFMTMFMFMLQERLFNIFLLYGILTRPRS